MTDGISNNLKSTLAYQIAVKLDAQDGTADGQISKSIWDGFVADKGGRQIEESISLKEAINFIATNLVRQAKTAGKTVDELAKEWLGKVNSSETPASGETKKSGGTEQADGAATTPPVKAPISEVPPPKTFPPDVNIPENDTNPPIMSDPKMKGKAYSEVKEKDGIYCYDCNGRLESIRNYMGRQIQRFYYNDEGSIELYSRFKYNACGDNTRTVSYTPDGAVSHYHDQMYNNDHLVTSEIWRLSDGSVYGHGCTRTYEYNADGKETRRIYYNSDGSVDNYLDTEYYANGNKTRKVYRDANGNVKEYTVYDKDGPFMVTDYNPDGTKRE